MGGVGRASDSLRGRSPSGPASPYMPPHIAGGPEDWGFLVGSRAAFFGPCWIIAIYYFVHYSVRGLGGSVGGSHLVAYTRTNTGAGVPELREPPCRHRLFFFYPPLLSFSFTLGVVYCFTPLYLVHTSTAIYVLPLPFLSSVSPTHRAVQAETAHHELRPSVPGFRPLDPATQG